VELEEVIEKWISEKNDNDFYLGVLLRVGQGFARNLRKTIVIVYARLCCKASRVFTSATLMIPFAQRFPLPSLTHPTAQSVFTGCKNHF
jgi:hypothetical protein